MEQYFLLYLLNYFFPDPGWQDIYDNDIYSLLILRDIELTDEVKQQLLGGEVNVWAEQVIDY